MARCPLANLLCGLVCRKSKGVMIIFRTQQHEAEEDGDASAELQSPTEDLLHYRVGEA